MEKRDEFLSGSRIGFLLAGLGLLLSKIGVYEIGFLLWLILLSSVSFLVNKRISFFRGVLFPQ